MNKFKAFILLTFIAILIFIVGFIVKQNERPANQVKQQLTPSINGRQQAFDFIKTFNNVVSVMAKVGRLNNHRNGCGVIFNKGYIITNRHIIDNAESVYVSIGQKEVKAEIVGSNRDLDIAILKVAENNLPSAKFDKSFNIKLGQKIYVLGKSNKSINTVTSGVISTLPLDLPGGLPKLLAIDAVINQGNSGGPVVDDKGYVIAISTAYQSTGMQTQGLGFAIPIDNVIKAAEEILKNE